jgi:spore germination protein
LNQQLSRSQVLMIGSAFVLDATLISIPSLVIRDLESDFWMGLLFALLYGLTATGLVAAVSSRFPRKDLFQGLAETYPIIGKIAVLGYACFFLGILIRDIRSASDFVEVSLLSVTPLTVVVIALTLCIIATTRHGKIIVARMSQVWQPLLAILILFIPFALGGALQFTNLAPFFQHPPTEVFMGGSHLFSYTGEGIGIMMIATYRSWSIRYSLYSVLFGWFLLSVLTLSVVLSLGVDIPARTLYPNYEMVRKIRLTDFLDRVDLPMIGIWLPAMMVKTSFSLYIVSNGVSRLFPKLRLSWIVFAVGIGAGAIALFAFDNSIQILELNLIWTPIAVGFQIALPALLLLFLRRRRKAGKDEEPSSA